MFRITNHLVTLSDIESENCYWVVYRTTEPCTERKYQHSQNFPLIFPSAMKYPNLKVIELIEFPRKSRASKWILDRGRSCTGKMCQFPGLCSNISIDLSPTKYPNLAIQELKALKGRIAFPGKSTGSKWILQHERRRQSQSVRTKTLERAPAYSRNRPRNP